MEVNQLSASEDLLAAGCQIGSDSDGTLRYYLQEYQRLMFRREVAILLVPLSFNGLSLAFTFTFQACITNTFKEQNLIPLMQVVQGCTEVLGALFVQKLTAKIGNKIAVLILYIIALLAFYLMFLTFPASSAHHVAMETPSYLTPSVPLVLIISALFGIYDSGYNILTNYTIGLLFRSDSEVGFAVFNATTSTVTGVIFLISSVVE